MGYQVPKSDHPWRQYKDREYKAEKPKKDKKRKPPKVLVREIASSWDTIEIYTYSYGKEGRFSLNELPHHKQVAWFVGLLKKAYQNGE